MKQKLAIALTGIVMLVASVPAANAAPVRCSGKTKEGSTITFVVAAGKIKSLSTLVPTSCVSAQGGSPQAGLDFFRPPGGFPIGKETKRKAGKQETPMTYYEVTKSYTVKAKRSGKRITGELASNWSWVDISVPKLFACLGNAHFTASPP